MGTVGALSLKTELSLLLQVGGKWGAGGGRGADHPFLGAGYMEKFQPGC